MSVVFFLFTLKQEPTIQNGVSFVLTKMVVIFRSAELIWSKTYLKDSIEVNMWIPPCRFFLNSASTIS